jgi:hypothetical protein
VVYVRTGRPPGRPRKPVYDPNAPAPPALVTLAPLDLTGITDPEKRMKAALAQIMGGLHEQMPAILGAVAEKDPKWVATFYKDTAEYLSPKLSRSEQTLDVNQKVSHFVAVSDREVDPSRVIDSTAVEVQ